MGLRERKPHKTKAEKIYNQLSKYPTHHERIWYLLVDPTYRKQITYDEYEQIFYTLNDV